jgi:hypothetical protein
MNFKSDLPEIAAIRAEVERKIGIPLRTHNDFVLLADQIDCELKEHMSETTLERVWGYSTRGYDTVSHRTLSVLARYLGHADWNAYTEHLRHEAQRESEYFSHDTILCQDIAVGTRVRLGWQPNRIIVVRYLGNNRFVTEISENSSIQPGDKFSCLQLQKGQPLYMDLFQRATDNGEPDPGSRYVVGQNNGLTTAEILK